MCAFYVFERERITFILQSIDTGARCIPQCKDKRALITYNMFTIKISPVICRMQDHIKAFESRENDVLRYQEFIDILRHPELKIIGFAISFYISFYFFYAIRVSYYGGKLKRCERKVGEKPKTYNR